MTNREYFTGEEAIAEASIKASIRMASGYPGSPGGGVISLLKEKNLIGCDVHWSSNEKIALEKAIGVAINGLNALVCIKSVGFNAMLDPLTVLNLTPTSGGLVIILGDDPGAYGSQNDQDSRPLARFLNIPWFEPCDVQEAYDLTLLAFKLARSTGLPVVIRITRSLALRRARVNMSKTAILTDLDPFAAKNHNRYVPGPKNAVDKSYEQLARMEWVAGWLNGSGLNQFYTNGNKQYGLILCGSAKFKMQEVIDLGELSEVANILVLNSIHPLPERDLLEFLSTIKTVIVIEENTSLIAEQCSKIALKLKEPITWKVLAKPGELFRRDIHNFLISNIPGINLKQKIFANEAPQLKGNCADSRYGEVLDILDAVCERYNLTPRYYGDPGCLVTVVDRLYAKYAMGGSVSTVFGANLVESDDTINIALVGDSGLFHSALPAIIDATYLKMPIAIILLNNNAALTTGGQLHPGSSINGNDYDYASLFQRCGVQDCWRLNLDDKKEQQDRIAGDFISSENIRVLQIDITNHKQIQGSST